MKSILASLLVALLPFVASASVDTHAAKLAPLISPTKLATLGTRGANPRIQKAVAILEDAQRANCALSAVAAAAVKRAGYLEALKPITFLPLATVCRSA